MSPAAESAIMEEMGLALVGRYAWRSPTAKIRFISATVEEVTMSITGREHVDPREVWAEPPITELREKIRAALTKVIDAAVQYGDLIPMIEA